MYTYNYIRLFSLIALSHVGLIVGLAGRLWKGMGKFLPPKYDHGTVSGCPNHPLKKE